MITEQFQVGDRVLVTITDSQDVVNEPATIEDVDEEANLYWCVFDRKVERPLVASTSYEEALFDPQWCLASELRRM